MSITLIDGLWYFGGNRQRGIGRYLEYFFQHECAIDPKDRVWLVPQSGSDRLVNELLAKFGGRSLVFDFTETKPRQLELMRRFLDEKKVTEVWVSSPFERPWSLLDFQALFAEIEIPVTAVVFDLLPLQFPDKILATWSQGDQHLYQRRTQKLQAG